MRNNPEFFPPSSILDEVTGRQEATVDIDDNFSTDSIIEVVSEEHDIDFDDDDWI